MDRMFVAVRCECYEDGTVLPIGITWPDGRFWEITRTLHVSEAVDGEYEGIRYTVLIGSAEKYIYRSRDMRCPVCGFKVTEVPLTQTEPVYVRCGKCKFAGALSPAYVRRMKRYAEGLSGCMGSAFRTKR